MSDVPRLRIWFEDGSLIRPDAAAPNIVDLARAMASLTGVADLVPTAGASRMASLIGAAMHYVFVLVDGLGMKLVEQQPAGGFLRTHTAIELQTVAPSSTAPALTTLATGLWPAEHAVPGWFTHLPDAGITATILPYVERYSGRDARECGADPAASFPAPPLSMRTPRRQLRVMPKAINGSVYSRYSGGGAESYGYASLTEAIETIVDAVAGADEATSTYLYIPFVDTAEHEHGPHSAEVAAVLARVCARLETLCVRLSGRARVLVTADHGQVLVDRADQVELVNGDPLLALLRFPPTCEPRLPAFHVRDGAHAAFESAFRTRFGEQWALLSLDEAQELRLFGPVPLSAETRRRLGDYVAICCGRKAILYRPGEPMLGFHGGLLADEMRVPLILA